MIVPTTAGFLAAADAEADKLAGYIRLLASAKARGNESGVSLAARSALRTLDKIENLIALAGEFSSK